MMKDTVSGMWKRVELNLGLWRKLRLCNFPFDIGIFRELLVFLVLGGQSSFFFKVIGVDKDFGVVSCNGLIFVVDGRSANNIEFGLVDKGQMTVSLLWLGVVWCDIFAFTYEFRCGRKLKTIVRWEEFDLLVAHWTYGLYSRWLKLNCWLIKNNIKEYDYK